ncbi:hypothetical protein [Pseudomonas migulae]|uniref:Uncharacterized protein n=1 Tax=Pseudomonas migulae TaxID=78543 RepID=A0ABY8N0H8_9PSED|nr:hypothetical protein [Pseudomonas migulae]WGK92326.1 hypothetical protein MOQ58_09060 [Pseudomonas migulae]
MTDKDRKGRSAFDIASDNIKKWGGISSSSSSTSSGNIYSNPKNTSSSSDFNTRIEPHPVSDINKQVDDYIEVALDTVATKVDAIYKEKMVLINQAEKKLAGMINNSTTLLKDLEAKLTTVTELTNRSIDIQNTLQEEIKYIKGNAISALAIFVSFFAFITVTLNVFSKAGSVVSAAILVLIFWCLLIGFNLIIAIQFKVFAGSKVIWCSLGAVILVSVLAVLGLYYFSPELRGVKAIFLFAT